MNGKPNLTLVDETLSIKSPITTVFGFLSDHENYIRWFPGVVSVTSHDDLPHGAVGKIYSEALRMPTGRTRTISIEVLESQPPTLFVMQADFALLHPRTEIRLRSETPDETVVNWKFFSRSQSAIGRLLIGTLVRKSLARRSEMGLLELKRILEGGGAMTGAIEPIA